MVFGYDIIEINCFINGIPWPKFYRNLVNKSTTYSLLIKKVLDNRFPKQSFDLVLNQQAIYSNFVQRKSHSFNYKFIIVPLVNGTTQIVSYF